MRWGRGCLLAKFCGHKSYRNGDISSHINCYIDILEKAELTASIRHIARFLKPGKPIYDSRVRDAASAAIRRVL